MSSKLKVFYFYSLLPTLLRYKFQTIWFTHSKYTVCHFNKSSYVTIATINFRIFSLLRINSMLTSSHSSQSFNHSHQPTGLFGVLSLESDRVGFLYLTAFSDRNGFMAQVSDIMHLDSMIFFIGKWYPVVWEVEAGRSEIQGQPQVYRKVQVHWNAQDSVSLSLKKKKCIAWI